MAAFTVQQGKRYRATIKLGFFERLVSNASIIDRLLGAGFSDVKVWGMGGTRLAEGTWHAETASAEMPSQIAFVEPLP